ncbi:ubiquinol oxidase subunit II [Candidatus Saccharibacteria bacterium]|nr:ubiquinol oxidase subunit II [Candidatus Saccharibacteria bacterium]
MKRKYKVLFFALLATAAVVALILYLKTSNVAVLNPKGVIASKERDLIITTTMLMLIVVIPVFILTFFIAWKYRASNTKAKYSPDLDHNRLIEFTWWAIPTVIIVVLSLITWRSTHELDPFRPIAVNKKPITVQVVALQWKWLFIYPEQNIATVNLVQFPVDTPVSFEITSDAPMNSFWIPQLGGQVYAMAGMKTKLHLIAGEAGDFRGSSANISGRGFAGMDFTARSSSRGNFNSWVESVKSTGSTLSLDQYKMLAKPSQNNKVTYFSSTEDNLQGKVIMKYMAPGVFGQAGYQDGSYSEYDSNGHH